MKSVLMIAYHFPPIAGSSGVQRTLQFARHLPALGWRPIVLSISPRAYRRTSPDLLADIPSEAIVVRAFGLDAARHLSLLGLYPGFAARPDRWASWIPGALLLGRRVLRRHRPAAIWSTFPIASAHRIALGLHAHSGLPWIADFRDPMAQPDYPPEPAARDRLARLEASVARHASAATFTTPGALSAYAARHPARRGDTILIENGYDEASFPAPGTLDPSPLRPGRLTLLHSGIVYPDERDPSALIAALARLRQAAPGLYPHISVRFRAAVHEDTLRDLVRRYEVADAVEILPPLAYREALAEMLRADALLILQAANCNAQIPAKLYECLRAGRPLLALTDPGGDTAATLRDYGADWMAPLDDPQAVAVALERLSDTAALAAARPRGDTRRAERSHRSTALAQLLERMT